MIVKTTRLGGTARGHQHTVYLPVRDGRPLRVESETTTDKGHSHQVVWQQPTVINPQTFQRVPVGEGAWVVAPDPDDGHTHDLAGEPERKPDKDELDDAGKVKMVRGLFKETKNWEADARKDAEEAEGFYTGAAQWTDTDRQILESTNRPCLTINLTQPAVDSLSGYQRQNRTDIRFLPAENSDGRIADVFTALVKNICERNEFDQVETRVFEDLAILGRGSFQSYIDFDKNIQGEIVIERYPWDEAFFGPHEKQDASDCEYICKSKWYSKEKLTQLWPDKAEEIQACYDANFAGEDKSPHQRHEGEQYEKSTNAVPADSLSSDRSDFINIARKEFRVIELQKKEYHRVAVLVNAGDDFTVNTDGWSASDIKAARGLPGFNVIYRRVDNLRAYTVAGDVLLDEWQKDDGEFDLTVAYAKKRKSMWWGKVHPAKDIQRVLNKMYSQGVDIVNKMAAYGWFYDGETFDNPQEEQNFKKSSSQPGFTAKVKDLRKEPKQVSGTKIPAEVLEVQRNAASALREVVNVNPEMLGLDSNANSGVAIMERRRQGLIGNEFLFDNLDAAKRRLALRLVKLIQDCYTPQRIMRVIGNRSARMPVEIGGKPFKDFDQQERSELQAMLENKDAVKFDISVGESAHSPTMKMSNFLMLLELAQAGVAIPPEMFIENSPMPEDSKIKALQAISQQKQAAQQEAEQKMRMELGKTLIAKGGDTGQPQGVLPQGTGMPPQGVM